MSPLSSLPTDCLPAAPADASALACGLPPADTNASFESVLTRAAPAEKNTDAAGADSEKSPEDRSLPFGSVPPAAPAPFTAEQLAAVLAFLGSPAAQQPLPPPVAVEPVNFDFNCSSAPSDGDVELASEALGTHATPAPLNPSRPLFPAAPAPGPFGPAARPVRNSGASTSDTVTPAAPVVAGAPTPPAPPSPPDGALVPSPALPTQSAPSARELVEAGVDTVTYQLVPAPKGSAHAAVFAPLAENPAAPQSTAPAASASSTPTTPASAAPTAPVPTAAPAPMTEAQTVAAAAASATTSGVALQSKSDARPAARSLAKPGRENIAAPTLPSAATTASGVKSSISPNENKFVSVDGQQLPTVEPLVGTTIANWGESMRPETPHPLVSRVADAAIVRTEFSSLLGQPSSPEAAKAVPHAAQIVREIRDIADGLAAIERNSVEVRFNFNDTERLSVRVEYREGVVKTTFHTSSPELRDTLAREWQSQLPAGESRAYRVADPVFNVQPADARGFSLGGDASRQQRQPEASAQPAFYLPGQPGRTVSGRDTSSPAAPSTARSEHSVHLQAFA